MVRLKFCIRYAYTLRIRLKEFSALRGKRKGVERWEEKDKGEAQEAEDCGEKGGREWRRKRKENRMGKGRAKT